MRLEDFIEMLTEKRREHGDSEVMFMVNGSIIFGTCNVTIDRDYEEVIVEINEQ